MRAVVEFPDCPDRLLAICATQVLEAVVTFNRWYLAAARVPPLYETGVRHRDEPWAGRLEQFCPAPILLASGWGDCAQLAAWRTAELRNAGRRASMRCIMQAIRRPDGARDRLYHVQVRDQPTPEYPLGRIEDLTRRLEY